MTAGGPTSFQVSVQAGTATVRRLAHWLEREQLWSAAAEVLGEILNRQPDDWNAHLRRYDAFEKAGDEAGCRNSIEEFVAAAVARRASPAGLLRLLDAAGRDQHALALLAGVLQAQPGNWRLALQYLVRVDSHVVGDSVLTGLFSPEGPLRGVQHRAIVDQLAARSLVQHLDQALYVIAKTRPADWKLRWHGVAALLTMGEERLAAVHLQMLTAEPTLAGPSRRALLQEVLAQDEPGLLGAAVLAYDRADHAGLVASISACRDVRQLAMIRTAVDTLGGEAREALALPLAKALEAMGAGAQADQVMAWTGGVLGPPPAPRASSSTASTLMFRNLPLLRQLVAIVKAVVVRSGRARIHVGACSTGEEVYSLALLLQQAALIDACTIRASDVNPALLRRARTGVLEAEVVKAIPEELGALDLVPRRDGCLELGPATRRHITFAVEDLMESPPGQKFDLVIANNVLVHLPLPARDTMLRRLYEQLARDGLLCVGGVRHDELGGTLDALGLVAIRQGSNVAFDAWAIQRNAWYVSPRPYWALPPARHTADQPWKHASLFACTAEGARAVEDILGAAEV